MRRLLLSLALIGASVALGASVAFATNPTVSLSWSAAGVDPGDNAVLEIRVAGEVTGLYGSTIDVYYDAGSLTPVLGGATTAAGLLDLPGTDPPQSFSAVSSSAPDAPPRVSLISLRVGANPGVTDPAINGLLGRVEFQVNTLASAGSTISFSSVDSNVADPGVVWTRLVTTEGQAIGVVLGGPASIFVYGEPEIAFTSSLNPVLINQELNVSGIVDTVPVGSMVDLALDGSIVKNVVASANGTWSASLTSELNNLADGVHSLMATVMAGSASASANLSFTLDLVGPTVTINTSIVDVYEPTAITVDGTYVEATVQSISIAVGSGSFVPVSSFSGGIWTASPTVSPGDLIQVKIISSGNHQQLTSMVVPAVELSIASKPYHSMGQPVEVFGILRGDYSNIRKVVVELRLDSKLTLPVNARLADGLSGSIQANVTGDLVIVTATLDQGIQSTQPRADLFAIDFTPVSTGSSIFQVGTASVLSATDGIQFEDGNGAVIPNRKPFFVTLKIENTGTISGTIKLGGSVTADHGMTWVEVGGHTYNGTEVRVGAYTDANGMVSIPNVLTGTYDVWVRHFRLNPATEQVEPHRYLGVLITNVEVLADGTVLLPANIELVPGNAIDNEISQDTVFLEDLLVVTRAYGSSVGTENWDDRADLNGDFVIDVKDVELLAAAWAKIGAASDRPADPEFIK